MADSGAREFAPNGTPEQTAKPSTQTLLMEENARSEPVPAARSARVPRAQPSAILRLMAMIAASTAMFAIALVLAVAPVAAVIIALWATVTALIALARLVTLARAGEALTSPTTPTLLHTLDTAARVGYLALGYLALIFALITLMAGLLGRRWGRLFILPGAAFSMTALALIGIGALLAAPLASDLPISGTWLIPLALYMLVDAVLVSGVLVDPRPARLPKRRRPPSPGAKNRPTNGSLPSRDVALAKQRFNRALESPGQ